MKKRRLNKKKLVIFIFMNIFVIISLYSIYKIASYLLGNYNNKKIQTTIIENSVKIIEPDKEDEDKSIIYRIDFETLKKQNPDAIAYLKVPGTNIDYIVVKGEDNDYYLKHNFNKSSNVSGWIFADYHNMFDESDNNIVIYGHNTKDGSMFGTLKYTLKEEWRSVEDNHKILLVTENSTYYYEVFSTYSIDPEDYYITTGFNNTEEFETFIKTIKSRSNYNYHVELSSDDKILTLSSCTAGGTKRVVLHAKLIKDEIIEGE